MPYIPKDHRAAIDAAINEIRAPLITYGDLNYAITKLVLLFTSVAPSYTTYNSAIGVLECVKQELYRREIAPYEDKKKIENGDVF